MEQIWFLDVWKFDFKWNLWVEGSIWVCFYFEDVNYDQVKYFRFRFDCFNVGQGRGGAGSEVLVF